jgi:hypothetical protein
VSDLFHFTVLEPPEFAGIVVTAYGEVAPRLDGHLLRVDDRVHFVLPSEARRHGIYLLDLENLERAPRTPSGSPR